MIYGDLGISPVSVHVKIRMIKFWTSLITCQSDKYSNKIYKALYDLHKNGTYTSEWLNSIRNILIETGYDCVWETQQLSDVRSFSQNICLSLQNNYIHSWTETLNSSNKCLFYRNYKTVFMREKYVNQLPDMYIFPLIKFRCSSHKLMIEVGRRLGLAREDRICRDCDQHDIGDEFHFIMECPKYADLRSRFIPRKFTSVKSVYNYCRLFSAGKKVLLNLSKFIKLSKVV